MSQAGEPSACLKCRRKSPSVAVRDEFYPFKLCDPCWQAALGARRGVSAPDKFRSQSVASTDGSLIDEEESIEVHHRGTSWSPQIHNELLYFTQNQLDGGVPNDELVTILVDFYEEKELVRAKHLLLTLLPRKDSPEWKTRIGNNRNRQVAQDIVVLTQLPEITGSRFVAAYADRVPPISFKSLDVSVLMKSIKKMQEEIFEIKCKAMTREDVQKMIVARDERTPSCAPQPAVTGRGLWWEGGQEQAGGDGQGLQPASTSTKPPAPTTYARAAAPQDEQGGWQVQPSRHRGHTSTQQPNFSSNSMQQYPAPAGMKQPGRPRSKTLVIGKSTDHRGHLKVVSRRIQLFVSRLDPSTTVEEVEQFVKDEMDIDISAEKRETRHESYSSFIIHCQLSQKDVLLDGTKWPNNTLVKPWYPPRPKAEKLQLPQEGDAHGQESGTTSEEK